MKKKACFINGLIVAVAILLSGCSHAGDEGYTAGDLRGFNHMTNSGVNSFSVNGYGGTLTGNSCCIMLPDEWKPGLKAHIEWEVDPHTAPPFPGYKDREKFNSWKNALEGSFQKHSTIVDIPQYSKERCGLTVHFLPCDQVKVTTVCSGYGTPNYPIKEPLKMKEPASCPVK